MLFCVSISNAASCLGDSQLRSQLRSAPRPRVKAMPYALTWQIVFRARKMFFHQPQGRRLRYSVRRAFVQKKPAPQSSPSARRLGVSARLKRTGTA